MILDSFTIIDDQVVQQEDIANNYFLTEEDLNKQRGEVFIFPHSIENALENYSSLSTANSNYSRNIHSTFYLITRRRTRIQ